MIYIRKNNNYTSNITYKAKTLEAMVKYFSLLLGVEFKAKTLEELLIAINTETLGSNYYLFPTDNQYVKASHSGKKTYVAEERIPVLEQKVKENLENKIITNII